MKPTLIQRLNNKYNVDKYNPNTICGCLNRINRILGEGQLSEKYNLEPESDPIAWVFWKLQEAAFWPSDEFDFTQLKPDYEKSSKGIKYGVDLSNAWFAGGDGVIVKNSAFRFAMEAKSLPETGALLTQAKQEFVHSESYKRVIDSVELDPIKKNEILTAADNLPCVRNKELLMEQYMESDIPRGYRIAAFAAFEGISFWGSFLFIFWLRSLGLFKTLAELNEKIAIDESLHRDYACARFRELSDDEKPSYEEVIEIITEITELEVEFGRELTYKLEEEGYDLTPEVSKRFIYHMANNLLVGLGYEPYYTDSDVPEYMNSISSSQKSNFYEVNVAGYSQFSVSKLFNKNKNNNNNNNNDESLVNNKRNDNVDEIDF